MKILLIDSDGWGGGTNIGLAYISAILTENGHQVKVIDINNHRHNQEQRIREGMNWQPDFVGLSIYSSYNIQNGVRWLRFCQSISSAPLYVVGGHGASRFGKDFFYKYPDCFDILIKGEGEQSFLEIVNGVELSRIAGVIYRKDNCVHESVDRELNCDLDSLPYPDYDSFDYSPLSSNKYLIITSRGCPYNCVFCLNKVITKQRFRPRSPENVIGEIEYVIQKYGIREFQIYDDNFTFNIERAKKICQIIIEKNLNITFTLDDGIRADKVTPELAHLLKQAGCTYAFIAIENGDAETFKYVKKGTSLETTANAVRILKSEGIRVEGTTIIGLIGTTFESDMRSIDFIESLGINSIWHQAFPYRNTELYEWVKANGTFLDPTYDSYDIQLSQEDNFPIAFETPEYTKEERYRAYIIACVKSHQYTRPFQDPKNNMGKRILKASYIIFRHEPALFLPFMVGLLNTQTKRVLPKGNGNPKGAA